MKKITAAFFVFAFFLISASLAGAATHTFQPDPSDLWDLEHGHYYTWGIDWSVPTGERIVDASLFFNDIRNHDNSPNDLWVHLLDSATAGATLTPDTNGDNDDFAGQGILLEHWENLPSYSQDITYYFDHVSELTTLITYLTDGNFGLGFDPDCHFYNNGITLSIETTNAPVPASVLLLGSGLLGLVGFRRKTRKSTI